MGRIKIPRMPKGWVVEYVDREGGTHPHNYHKCGDIGDHLLFQIRNKNTGDMIWMSTRTNDKTDITKHYFNVYRSRPGEKGLDPNIKTLQQGIDFCCQLIPYFDAPTEKVPGARPGYYAGRPLFFDEPPATLAKNPCLDDVCKKKMK